MTIQLNVAMPAVYRRIGRISLRETYSRQLEPQAFDSRDYGLLLSWPREFKWLSIRADFTAPGPSMRRSFHDREAGLDQVCQTYRFGKESLAPSGVNFVQAYYFLIAAVTRGASITLEFEVDTDSSRFEEAVAKRPQPNLEQLTIPIDLFVFDNRGPSLLSEEGKLLLTLQPVARVGAFNGFAALDLGNSSSTVAVLKTGWLSTHDIRVVNLSGDRPILSTNASAVPSQVRIDTIRTWAGNQVVSDAQLRIFPAVPQDDFPSAIDWVIGFPAGAGTTRGLIHGAKRLMGDVDWEQTQRIRVTHQRQTQPKGPMPTIENDPIEIRNRLPAELLATRMLQYVSRAPFEGSGSSRPAGWPEHLAVTYPTTYAPVEIDRLRRTVYRAWLRSQHKPQSTIAVPQPVDADPLLERIAGLLQGRLGTSSGGSTRDDPLIPLLIDEATAAAFYFLYRRALESPGGLTAFRSKFPDGFRMLLYDCGGGTTDIALVEARVDAKDPRCLRIRVLGRSGIRHFGGDNITLAVCRLLKVKLARALAKDQGKAAQLPNYTAQPPTLENPDSRRTATAALVDFLRAVRPEVVDSFVPTRFDPEDLSTSADQRRDHTKTLWQWGETIKHLLGEKEKVSIKDLCEKLQLRLGIELGGLVEAMLLPMKNSPTFKSVVEETLPKVEIHRWEVDALIQRETARSVRCCIGLLRSLLGPRDELGRPTERLRTGMPDEERMLHWVVVTGNASRYPLIRETILQRLNMSDLEPNDWLHFEPAELKHAVAKGAVLALATIRGQGQVRIEFDTQLSECLPYDVGFKNLTINSHEVLFQRQERYDQLRARQVPLAVLTTNPDGPIKLDQFSLVRRFPGDGEGGDPNDPVVSLAGLSDEITELDRNEGFSRYLTFRFADGIQGDHLTVSYDPQTHQFSVHDAAGNQGVIVPTNDGIQRSPLQRGDL